MRAILLLPMFAVAACASGGGGATKPSTETVRVIGASGTSQVSMAGSDASNVHSLPYSLERVWRALPGVFDSLGVPITTMDPAKRTVGNTAFKVHGRLKGVPLSRYIDCGNSTQIGPNADSYDVSLVLLADVQSTGTNASAVTLTFEAVGRPATFAQEYSQCSSKATLESRFMDVLKSRLAS